MQIENYIFQILIIFWLILILTFFQKYYYILLNYLKNFFWLKYIINFIIRTWVILHEFSHIFFAFLAGNKIQEISLFSKNGWYVKYQYKNYIWALWEWFGYISFWIKLILNQVWIFLTSLWPLIVWIILTYFFWHNLIWVDNYNEILSKLSWKNIVYIWIYIILIPNFVLSWKDISHFIISKQNWFLATFIWSVINTLIFLWFIWIFNFVFNYFIIFCLSFFVWFLIILILNFFIFILNLFLKKFIER